MRSARSRGAWQRILPIALLVVVVGVFAGGTAKAQDGRLSEKFRSGPEATVAEGDTVSDDVYASAGRVAILGRVEGDLVAAGGEIEVSGTVTDDVLVAGGRVSLMGDVGGDVRAAGGQITVTGPVGEDAFLAGGQMTISEEAEIGGDLVFSGGTMRMDGRVEGDAIGNAGEYSRRGSVGGRETVSVRPEEGPPSVADLALDVVRRYIAILAVGALLLWLAPGFLRGAAGRARERPLPSLGVGLLGAIGFVLLLIAIVVAAVVISIPLGLLGFGELIAALGSGAVLAAAALTFAFILVVAFVADAIVGIATGRLFLSSDGRVSRGRDLRALALGVAIVVILTAIPFIGGAAKLLVVLAGLGAILLLARHRPAPAEP